MSEPFESWPEVMTIPDVIRYCDIPIHDAYKMFASPDFPLTVPGKKSDRRVGKFALRAWINKERG